MKMNELLPYPSYSSYFLFLEKVRAETQTWQGLEWYPYSSYSFFKDKLSCVRFYAL